ARILLRSEPEHATRIFEKLSASEASDPGLAFDRARSERRLGDSQRAESLFARLETQGSSRAHPQTWWSEANAQARQALQDKDNHLAYDLVAKVNLPSGEEFAESQFLAGWIALRLLKQPSVALTHFQRLNDAVGRP